MRRHAGRSDSASALARVHHELASTSRRARGHIQQPRLVSRVRIRLGIPPAELHVSLGMLMTRSCASPWAYFGSGLDLPESLQQLRRFVLDGVGKLVHSGPN